MDAITLYSTWPDLDSAKAGAGALVSARLAACVNLVPGAVSVYRWEGAVQEASEVVMIAKTSAARADAAREAIIARHPYATPCVTALRIEANGSHAEFLAWIEAETG